METLKAVAEPHRWRILECLAGEELCVCHLVEDLGLPQPLVSHHLRILREAGLVTSDKHRYWTYYRLRPEGLSAVTAALARFVTDAPDPGERRRPCC